MMISNLEALDMYLQKPSAKMTAARLQSIRDELARLIAVKSAAQQLIQARFGSAQYVRAWSVLVDAVEELQPKENGSEQ